MDLISWRRALGFSQMIDQYTTGSHMTVDGTTYHQDLKIIHDEVKGTWWRKEGHRLDIDDIQDILSAEPEVLYELNKISGVRIDVQKTEIRKQKTTVINNLAAGRR